jgi:hypothetical protein
MKLTQIDQAKALDTGLSKEALEFIMEYCGDNLTEADLLEIRGSLYHLGKAINYYNIQKVFEK